MPPTPQHADAPPPPPTYHGFPFAVLDPTAPHATIDWETKSEAGYVWNDETNKWGALPGAPQGKKGLQVVGSAVYAEHPTTDILTLSYLLPGDARPSRWRPGQPLPERLFAWVRSGGRIEAHKAMFERQHWEGIAVPRYGFPPVEPWQWACSMATAHVNAWPGALEKLGDVLELDVRKNAEGRRVLNKFSIPRNPTKGNPARWITPADDPADAEVLYTYCDDDVLTEHEASGRMLPMTYQERAFWLVDQEINHRGLAIDRKGVRDCIVILNQALARYGAEMRELTGGIEATQLERLKGWLAAQHVYVDSLDADAIESLLDRLAPHPPGGIFPARRAIEIRALIGSASVKKLFAMELTASNDNRIRDLIVHHGARTGRPTGEGAQPLNMPRGGPNLVTCGQLPNGEWAEGACRRPHHNGHDACPWCGLKTVTKPHLSWTPPMVDFVLEVMACHSLELVEWYFGDALLCIAGCLRGLFVAGEGNELIASDYSQIETVVTAELAGENWRCEVFRQKKDIYLVGCSKITGQTYEFYTDYKKQHGDHHPDRQYIGKVSELALGFGGWIGAWYNFDDTGKFNENEIKNLIKAWRKQSPNIVEFWGGQWRGWADNGYAELYGVEGAFIEAVRNPNTVTRIKQRDPETFQWKQTPDITFFYDGPADTLFITLLSGRRLTYHEPRLMPSQREWASPGEVSISYMTYNKNPKMGVMGWVRMSTFGGRLVENIVQATAHCLLRHAILQLRDAGFHTVLHVYDEIVVEVAKLPKMLAGMIDPWIARMEAIMSDPPWWARGWPVRASGGWRGYRYRKG